MIKYIEISNDLDEVLKLWNEEVGFIYPIAKDIFAQNVVNYKQKKVFGAYENDNMVGFIVGKSFLHPDLESYHNQAFISLLYVKKAYRRRGIASKLLKLIEEEYKDKDIINVGKDINNFFPGIPSDFIDVAESFFVNRGYSIGKYTHDLINCSCTKYKLKNSDFSFQVCSLADKDDLVSFMSKEFPGRWYFEVKDYFSKGGSGKEYVIAKQNSRIVAFTRLNDRTFKEYAYNTVWYPRFHNLFGVGPLGVAKDMRGKELGYDIVAFAINEAIDRGCKEIIIDWTSLMSFYQHFHFEIWKNYEYAKKEKNNLQNKSK